MNISPIVGALWQRRIRSIGSRANHNDSIRPGLVLSGRGAQVAAPSRTQQLARLRVDTHLIVIRAAIPVRGALLVAPAARRALPSARLLAGRARANNRIKNQIIQLVFAEISGDINLPDSHSIREVMPRPISNRSCGSTDGIGLSQLSVCLD